MHLLLDRPDVRYAPARHPLRLDAGRALRILMIESDVAVSRVVATALGDHGHDVVHCRTVEEGRQQAEDPTFDIILLDVVLTGGNGFDLCAELRRHGVGTPMLMVTARDSVHDRVRGLDVGADDYLTKPFAVEELMARIRSVDRRRRAAAPRQLRLADFEADLASGVVRRRGRPIELTVKESALLACFITYVDQVIDRTVITAFVWGPDEDVLPNMPETLVSRLRRKIDDPFKRKLVHTVRGAGYRFGL